MNSRDIREKFCNFFSSNSHKITPSSSVVLDNDTSLMFVNAGMVPFKNYFLAIDKPPYKSIASLQSCIRAGGKHNDLDNVGYTARHHTFFEMLGNFSFGDYFKKEAITMAWDFLTKVMNIPENRLIVTVYHDDIESEKIWENDIGVPKEKIIRCGEKDNFWSMGDVGPCGPCTEIFYDHGNSIYGGMPGSPNEDGDRFVEIWNIVFMEFNKKDKNTIESLPIKCVDTGMGLERLAAVMQNTHDNYNTDLFIPIINKAKEIFKNYEAPISSLKILADHIRSTVILINENIKPNNEGPGYVLRRIIRRALRQAINIGYSKPFFSNLVDICIQSLGSNYSFINKNKEYIKEIISKEEEQFILTLSKAMANFDKEKQHIHNNTITGQMAFKLYDTYGMPLDVLKEIAIENNYVIDTIGFNNLMEQQRTMARKSQDFSDKVFIDFSRINNTEFLGYNRVKCEAVIKLLTVDSKDLNKIDKQDSNATIIVDSTCFYAESGGQVGDKGFIYSLNGKSKFKVINTIKEGNIIFHQGILLKGSFNIEERVSLVVDSNVRYNTTLNHSATHILHSALKKVLGDEVSQMGSLVNEDRLRFDFSYDSTLSNKELIIIEDIVNDNIRNNIRRDVEVLSIDDAINSGATALFNEKYSDKVRVITFGEISKELCGGTHVNALGEIGIFKIVSQSSVGSGIRRIEAITGETALKFLQGMYDIIGKACGLLNTNKESLITTINQNICENKKYLKDIDSLNKYWEMHIVQNLINNSIMIKNIMIIISEIKEKDNNILRNIVDKVKNKSEQVIIVLYSKSSDKLNLVAGVSKSFTNISSIDLVREVCGSGGGRHDFAQGGSKDLTNSHSKLLSLKDYILKKI